MKVLIAHHWQLTAVALELSDVYNNVANLYSPFNGIIRKIKVRNKIT